MRCHLLLVLSSLLVRSALAAETATPADVVVYGGTPAGIAAALAAAEGGQQVLLIEPTGRVGGLMTNGLSHTDFRTFEGLNGTCFDFTQRVLDYYTDRYGPDSPQVQDCFRGTHAEPHVNLLVFEQMLAEQQTLSVRKRLRLVRVQTQPVERGRRIEAAEFTAGDETTLTIRADVWIDATYEGDLMAQAGVAYRVGREARDEFDESLAPETADKQVQGYNFRLIMTREPANRVTPVAPPGYRREDFRPVIELLEAGKFQSVFCYPSGGLYKAHEPNLPNGKYDINDVSRGLVRMSLPDINDKWPDGDPSTRQRIFNEHLRHNVGLLYFLQNDEAVPARFRDEARQWGWCRDEFVENGHLPEQLYIREARRLVGQYTFTEHDTDAAPHDARAVLRRDAIAMGDYGLNCHGTAHEGPRFGGRHTGEFYKAVPPYQIPYGVLVPKDCVNLLVPTACSASHVGFCALRLEPIWMSLGQAAGIAADVALDGGLAVPQVNVAEVQKQLHARGAATIYVSDVPPNSPDFAAVQWWGTQGGLHGLAEPPAKPGQRGAHITSQYYQAYPGHAAELDRPLDAALKARWMELAQSLELDTKPLETATTRGEFVRRAYALSATKSKSKEHFHLYLLIGQSNMAGRGILEDPAPAAHPRVLKFTKEQTWASGTDPLHFDKPIAGVGLGTSFAAALADADPEVTIGLIPCAVGGTPLSRWQNGGDLYVQAVARARAAMRDGTLKGILWHQGESDSAAEETAKSYGDRLAQMVGDLRKELGAEHVPFVAGELGRFLRRETKDGRPSYWPLVNEQLNSLPKRIPHAAVVSSEGLTDKGDGVHFDTPSLREFGRRYAAAMHSLQSRPTSRPNIVFILADDLGYGDLGCYNPQSKIPTPRLDAFAREGLRFTDAHSPSSVCSPTRYGILTGRYCWRTRLTSGVLWGFDHPLIEPDRETVASFLKRHGYATAGVGKWHLGLGWMTKDGNKGPWPDRSRDEPHDGGWGIDYTQPLRGGPTTLGFDEFFGIAASNNMPPYCFIEGDRVVGTPSVRKEPLNFGNTAAPMVPGWDDSQYGPTLTGRAVSFIERHHAEHPDQPFFLYFASQAPHRPCVPPEFVRGKSEAGRRGDMVAEFDWSVGQILDTLERLGLAENTLVFVTSDNGATPGDEFPPDSGQRNGNIYGITYGHKSCGNWRGYKSEIWEGGHRVPFLVRWPGHTPAGRVTEELICLTDLFGTLANLIGEKLPEGAGPDSVSLLPVLLGEPRSKPIREAVVHHDYAGRFAVRQGDWKYVAPFPQAARGDDPGALLFNLRVDPGETTNVLAEHPQVGRRLADLLEQYRAGGSSR